MVDVHIAVPMSRNLGQPAASPAAWAEAYGAQAAKMARRARHPAAALLEQAWRFRQLRGIAQRLCYRLEGGPLFSHTVREMLKLHHGVTVGPYSYGDILTPGLMPPGSAIGAYCSVGCGLIVRRRDHPVERLSQSPLFYNRKLGLVRRDTIPEERDNPLAIGNDVWIGDRVTILSGCAQIGDGAVLAAGAVVTRDVAPFTIVGGVPAKPLKQRFDDALAARVQASRWWELPLPDLLEHAPHLLMPCAEISPAAFAAIEAALGRVSERSA